MHAKSIFGPLASKLFLLFLCSCPLAVPFSSVFFNPARFSKFTGVVGDGYPQTSGLLYTSNSMARTDIVSTKNVNDGIHIEALPIVNNHIEEKFEDIRGNSCHRQQRQWRQQQQHDYHHQVAYDNRHLNGGHQQQQQEHRQRRSHKQRFIHPQVYKMFHRARYLIRQGNSSTAQKLLVRCLELNPYDSHSWLALARLEAKVGNIARARDVFAEGVKRCPNNVHILHAWGHLEQKHGNEALAREYWSRANALEPYNPYVCHALSNLERRQRNYERAKEVLMTVVEKKPTAALCVSLSDLERQLGFPEKSRSILLHGLQKCEKDRSKLYLALAWLEEDVFKNQNEAARLITEALKIDKNNVRVYVAKASMELRLERQLDAHRTLQHALTLESEDGQHYTMLGTLELEMGNVVEAGHILKEGASKFPGDQFLLQRWGTLEAKLGNIDKARGLFERSVSIQPHAPTFVAWAILEEKEGLKKLHSNYSPSDVYNHLRIGSDTPSWIQDDIADGVEQVDHDLTVRDLEILSPVELDNSPSETTLDPFSDLPPASSSLEHDAVTYCKDQVDKARYLLSIGEIVDPQHGPLYHAYGNMELRHGNVTGAREIFTRGISMNCSDVTSLFHAWGLLELREGDNDKAASIFKHGIEIGLKGNREVENGVSFLLHSLGMLELMDRHRFDEAEKIFSTGVSLFPKHSQMQLGLAMASMKLGAEEKARKCFRSAVDADPYHAHAWQAWAIAEKQCCRIELARALFRQGLKKNPTHGALWQAFAVMEMHQNNHEVARSLFSQALMRCPRHAQSYQAWACLEVRMGNLKKAKDLALHGIKLAPSHPALWTVAGLVEDKLGDSLRAKHIFKRGLERFPR